MNNQQDTVATTVSILDLADQLLHRLRNRLAGMSDVYLPHDFTLNELLRLLKARRR